MSRAAMQHVELDEAAVVPPVADAAEFLGRIRERLENPLELAL